MGNLILCYKKQAKNPYEIIRIHRRIHTIEELCYYLCNNLYLVDYTIMNEKLCFWLRDELGLEKLSEQLLKLLDEQGSIEAFVMSILESSNIYTELEIIHITNILEKLKNQKEVERQKYMGDNLLKSGELEPAILAYQAILRGDKDESVDKKFYGRVYACLGAAYGRILLYEEAAKMYEAAYEICREYSMLSPYLYAVSQFLTNQEYEDLIKSNDLLMEAHKDLEERKQLFLAEHQFHSLGDELTEWKEEYRRR